MFVTLGCYSQTYSSDVQLTEYSYKGLRHIVIENNIATIELPNDMIYKVSLGVAKEEDGVITYEITSEPNSKLVIYKDKIFINIKNNLKITYYLK